MGFVSTIPDSPRGTLIASTQPSGKGEQFIESYLSQQSPILQPKNHPRREVLGARNGVRTRNLILGKNVLYQLSYSRISSTILRIPLNAASGVLANQLRLGNSVHNPTYSLSSSDQITLNVLVSILLTPCIVLHVREVRFVDISEFS